MRKNAMFFLAISLTTILFVACQGPSQGLSEAQKTAIADSVRSLVLQIEKGINNLDLDSQFKLFTDDNDFTWAANGQLMPPKDSLFSLYKPIYSSFQMIQFAWDTIRISVLGPDAGVFTGRAHEILTDNKGKESRVQVVATYAFARRQGTWKLIHGHFSYASPTK